MAKTEKSGGRTVFVCQQCGREELKWLGRCPSCNEWNSFYEQKITAPVRSSRAVTSSNQPLELSQVDTETADRFSLPMPEFNRVLGGGIVPGSLVLIGGDPGIGIKGLDIPVSHVVGQDEDDVGRTALRIRRALVC